MTAFDGALGTARNIEGSRFALRIVAAQIRNELQVVVANAEHLDKLYGYEWAQAGSQRLTDLTDAAARITALCDALAGRP